MSWDSKTNDQWLTVSDVSGKIGSGITAYGSAPGGKASNEYVTRSEFQAWIETTNNLTTDARWITKNLVNSYIINLFNVPIKGYNGSGSGYTGGGWSNASDAITFGNSGISYSGVYFLHSTPTLNDNLYQNAFGNFTYNNYQSPQDQWYYVPSANCAILLRGTNPSGGNYGNPIYIADIVNQYTMSYNIANNNNALFVQGTIYKNGAIQVQTSGSPAGGLVGTFYIAAGDTIRALITVTAIEGFTQSIVISGGATFSQSGLDSNIDSGTLTPTADTTIAMDLS